MKLILSLFLVINSSYALDLKGLVDQVKNKIESISGNKKPEKMATKIKMPKLPEIKKDATSTDVYKKEGKIYLQGQAFEKLTIEQKRKYRIAFLQELHLVVFEAEASKDQIISSLNILEKGGSREGVYRSLVLGDDYAALERFETTPNKTLINYVIEFGNKYLEKKFSSELLEKLNLYGIKRILTEKVLELVDAFPSDGEDLRSWYALMSAEQATRFQNVWEGKIRKSEFPEVHYNWSGTVSLQHIKSEIIIKLHKSLNSIQK